MVGIYALLWENIGQIYIGQSCRIQDRTTAHLKSLSSGTHYNNKVQRTYNEFGIPKIIVIEECSLEDLDTKETSWIKEFDAINNGLNIAVGGKNAVGVNNFASKYTKHTILKIFSLLYKTNLTHLEISKKLKVHIGTVSAICTGGRHSWLRDLYPGKYKSMQDNRTNITKEKAYPVLLGPQGEEYMITNIKEFCDSLPDLNLLPSHISSVLRGVRKTHKGFLLKNNETPMAKRPAHNLVDAEGYEYLNIINITKFCSEHPVLSKVPQARKGISRLVNKERQTYLGFKLLVEV